MFGALVVVFVPFKTNGNEMSLVSFALKEYLRMYSRDDEWDSMISDIGKWLLNGLSIDKSDPDEEIIIKFPINPLIVEVLERTCYHHHIEVLDLSKYEDRQENIVLEKFLGKVLFSKEYIELKANIHGALN